MQSVLYLVHGSDPDMLPENWLRLLPALEQERALRYRHAGDRWRFVVGRLMIRSVMSLYAGCRPHALPLCIDRHDRPVIAELSTPQFSLAHSGSQVALLVSDGACGVDVECVRAGRVSATLYRRIVGRDDEPRDIELFFRYWTRKEAVMKAHGMGLSLAPERIGVDFAGANAGVVRVDGLATPLWVCDLALVPGCALAAAMEGVSPSWPDVRSVDLSQLTCRWN